MMILLAQTTATTAASALTLAAFPLLLVAIPVLLVGEQVVNRVRVIRESNIPAPIVGGLLAALLVLAFQKIGNVPLRIDGDTSHAFWNWLVLPQWELNWGTKLGVERPLLIVFFTCIGLNASWAVAKKGGLPLMIYLAMASAFVLVQNFIGIGMAYLMGQSPLLGLVCGSVTLMGGFGTAAGFAPELTKAGLADATTLGVAAAAFGVIAGSLIGGAIAGRLIRKKVRNFIETDPVAAEAAQRFQVILPDAGQHPTLPVEHAAAQDAPYDKGGFIQDILNLSRHWKSVLIHLVVLFACLKCGAILSALVGSWKIAGQSITFPVYMGAMILAAVVRNTHDALRWQLLDSLRVDLIASFALAWLLAVVMIRLQLGDLLQTGGPMLAILSVQVLLMGAFSYWVVFRVMGRDYEAAMMSAGMIGFGLGSTNNAVATMRSLANRFGPAPRAFLIVTVVGAFLIDFTNVILIATFLNLIR